jgi:hypothetical protein
MWQTQPVAAGALAGIAGGLVFGALMTAMMPPMMGMIGSLLGVPSLGWGCISSSARSSGRLWAIGRPAGLQSSDWAPSCIRYHGKAGPSSRTC